MVLPSGSGGDDSQASFLVPTVHAISVVTVAVLPIFLLGASAVQIMRALHFDEVLLGLAVAVFFAAGALCAVVAGHLSERLGSSRLMRAVALLAALPMLAAGLAADNWVDLVLILIAAGMINGMTQPPVNQFLSESIPRSRQGVAFGIKQAAIPVATLLAGLSVPTLALTVGWRWAFIGGAALAVVVGLRVPAGGPRPLRRGPHRKRPSQIRYRPLIVTAAGVALGAGAANSMGAFLVSSTVHIGVQNGTAGLLAAFGSAVAMASRVVVGVAGDRIRQRHLELVAVMLLAGSVGYILLATGYAALLVPGVAIAFGAGWGWNGLFQFAVVNAHRKAPARASGVTQTGLYVGGVLGPLIFGLLAKDVSYEAAWVGAASAACLAALGMMLGQRLLASGPLPISVDG